MFKKLPRLEFPYGAPAAAGGAPPVSFINNGNFRVCQTHPLANQNYDVAQQMNGANVQVFDNMPDFFGYQYSAAVATNGPSAAVLFDDPVTGANGLSWSLRRNGALSAAAADYLYAFTSIEYRDFSPLLTQSAVLRFWIKQTNIGTFPLLLTTNPANNGPVPISSGNNFLTSYVYTASGVWQEFSVPLTFPSAGMTYPNPFTTDLGCRIIWPLFLGATVRVAPALAGAWVNSPGLAGFGTTTDSNAHQNLADTWQIARVRLQFDAGDYPDQDFTSALQAARRRYWHTFPYGTVPAAGLGATGETIRYIPQIGGVNTDGVLVQHPVQMRIRPAVTFYSQAGAGTKWRNETAGADSAAAVLGAPAAPSGFDKMLITNAQVAGDNGGDLVSLQASFDARI